MAVLAAGLRVLVALPRRGAPSLPAPPTRHQRWMFTGIPPWPTSRGERHVGSVGAAPAPIMAGVASLARRVRVSIITANGTQLVEELTIPHLRDYTGLLVSELLVRLGLACQSARVGSRGLCVRACVGVWDLTHDAVCARSLCGYCWHRRRDAFHAPVAPPCRTIVGILRAYRCVWVGGWVGGGGARCRVVGKQACWNVRTHIMV
jgi:hypothetical protein